MTFSMFYVLLLQSFFVYLKLLSLSINMYVLCTYTIVGIVKSNQTYSYFLFSFTEYRESYSRFPQAFGMETSGRYATFHSPFILNV